MVLDERVHRSIVSLDVGGGGKYGKEVVMEVSAKNMGPTADKEGMAMLSMEVSMIGMTLSGVSGPYESW